MPESYTYDIACSDLSGGVTSTMAGGDFWDGVCNGLICAGLNHAMHLVAEGGSLDDPPEKNKQAEADKERMAKETAAVGGGMATLTETAAKLAKLEALEGASGGIGIGIAGKNILDTYERWNSGEYSDGSAAHRIVMSTLEIIAVKIPVLGSVGSVILGCYDIGGGFDNTFYNDAWCREAFNNPQCKEYFDRTSSYKSNHIDYYHHGF